MEVEMLSTLSVICRSFFDFFFFFTQRTVYSVCGHNLVVIDIMKGNPHPSPPLKVGQASSHAQTERGGDVALPV